MDKKTVLAFHRDLVKTYGGKQGVRDEELALVQPQMSFGGHYVHDSIFKMAAAYGFHIAKKPSLS